METTTASAYREGRQKLVTVTTGAVFRIRKAPPRTVVKLLRIFDIKVKAGLKQEEVKDTLDEQLKKVEITEKLEEVMCTLLPDCTVEPRIVLKENPEHEGALLIDELDPMDAFDLLEEEMEFSGLGGRARRVRKSFREE